MAGNESCPQPQTSEHLAAVEIMRLKNIIILQNKVDLVKPDQAEAQHDQVSISSSLAVPFLSSHFLLSILYELLCVAHRSFFFF